MAENKEDQNFLDDVKSLDTESSEKPVERDETFTPEQEEEFDKEYNLEEKYGDSDLRTFGEAAVSSATFGLSDQALTKSGLVSKEDLRERRKRNSTAALAGEITGVVAPALLSGGSSILAKVTGAGVKSAAKAGLTVERLTAKSINKLISETGKRSLAREVLRKSITKGAGSAVEGSFYGTGKLISEEALGNADFNAENFIAHTGSGALFGGAIGSALVPIQAVVPVIKGNKITGWVSKKFKGKLDPAHNAQQLAGVTPSKIHAVKKFSPALYEHTPEMLKEMAGKKGVSAFSSNTKLFKSVNEFIEDTGKAIGKSLDDVSEALAAKGALPKRSQLAQRIVLKLDDIKAQFKDSNGRVLAGQKPKLVKIDRIIKSFDEDLISDTILSTRGVNELKSKYQKLAKWDRRGNVPLDEEINRQISRALREEVGELAKKAGGDAGAKLDRQMLNYGSAVEFATNFGKKIDSQSSKDFLSIKELFLGGMLGKGGIALAALNRFSKSDLKRKLIILSGIEKANIKVNSKIGKGVKNFLKGKRVIQPASTKALLHSKIAERHEDGKLPKKPKNKKEAFINMQKNLNDLQDPENAHAMVNIGNMEEAAPLAAQQTQMTLMTAAQFLFSKMPKDVSSRGIFTKREYQPSTIEIAKFEKYIQAIENPMTIIDELQNGTITRESVEAVQAVYPNLYQRIQEKVMTEIVKNPEEISYEKRLNLGILLDLPTDAALYPDNIRALQGHYKEAEAAQGGGALSFSKSKAGKMDMAESRATTTQKAKSGKVGD